MGDSVHFPDSGQHIIILRKRKKGVRERDRGKLFNITMMITMMMIIIIIIIP